MKKNNPNDPCKFAYQGNDNDIVIITCAMGDYYEVHVYQNREQALTDIYNAWVCHYAVLFCSDDELMKEHEKEIQYEPPRYGDEMEVVDEKGNFHATT